MKSVVKTDTPPTGWLIPAALLLLSAVPIAAGAFRIAELTGGGSVTPDKITLENARFFASPLPVTLHIVGSSLYAVLGAFQFAPGFCRRHPGWHRAAGRVLVVCGLAAALSGLWMTQFYPPPDYDGRLLYALRLLFGSAMVLSLVLGVAAIRQRDFAGHRAWMIRAYAVGLGAGTQVFTHLPLLLFPDALGELTRALCMGAGWVLNLAVAEWLIRRQHSRPTLTATV